MNIAPKYEFQTQEHANMVGKLFGLAYESLLSIDDNSNTIHPHIDDVIRVMRDHPEYEEVFKGVVLYPDDNGFRMFKVEDKLAGLKLD